MPLTTVAMTAEIPALGVLTWPQLEAWAVTMRDELPAATLAAALEDLQARLIDEVCGPKWLPVRDLPAPFGCPGCGVMSDFARKGMRTRPRRFDTAAGIVRLHLANVGCRSCGRVFAPLLQMLDLMGKRRTDRLSVELAELASQMSFARAGAIAAGFGLPASAGRAHHAVADVAARLDGVGDPEAGGPARADVVILDGTGMRATSRRLGVDCNIALGLTGRDGPKRRRRAATSLVGLTIGEGWAAMAPQLTVLEPPAMVVVDGEVAITKLAEAVWPDVPIQRCWWHLPRALRWALYADKADNAWANTKRVELVELLRRAAENTKHQRKPCSTTTGSGQRSPVTTQPVNCSTAPANRSSPACAPNCDSNSRTSADPRWAAGSSNGSCANSMPAPTSGGSRWSLAGLRDLVTVQLARMTSHPAWTTIKTASHPPNTIPFTIRTAKFNAC